MKYAEFKIDSKIVQLPVIEGAMNEKGLDISKLRNETGCFTMDKRK